MYDYIRPEMACTECPTYKGRVGIAFQPREVGRYQNLPYTLLCRFHVGALRMQNAKTTKSNASRLANYPDAYQYPLNTWSDITDDIRQQEADRYAKESLARDAKREEQENRAERAAERYTRTAKGKARKARGLAMPVVSTDVTMTTADEGTHLTLSVTLSDGTTFDVARARITQPTYSTWDDGRFSPSIVTITEFADLWLYRLSPRVAQALADLSLAAQLKAAGQDRDYLA